MMENPGDQPMSLVDHLVELRNRLLRVLLVLLVIFLATFSFASEIYTFVAKPLLDALPNGGNMIATGVISPFLTPFKLCIYTSLFLAMPVILHQVWGFVAPGLYQHEKKIAIPLLVSSVLLFYAGLVFAYFVVLPLLFGFMASIQLEGVTYMPDINDNLGVMLKLFFAFGLAFEVPVATVLLVWSGLVSTASLQDKRPYVVVACFVAGMLLTPPDVISQTLLAVPMWLLFELGLLFGRMVEQREIPGEEAAEDAPENTGKRSS